jgi:hypothetical protein
MFNIKVQLAPTKPAASHDILSQGRPHVDLLGHRTPARSRHYCRPRVAVDGRCCRGGCSHCCHASSLRGQRPTERPAAATTSRCPIAEAAKATAVTCCRRGRVCTDRTAAVRLPAVSGASVRRRGCPSSNPNTHGSCCCCNGCGVVCVGRQNQALQVDPGITNRVVGKPKLQLAPTSCVC